MCSKLFSLSEYVLKIDFGPVFVILEQFEILVLFGQKGTDLSHRKQLPLSASGGQKMGQNCTPEVKNQNFAL